MLHVQHFEQVVFMTVLANNNLTNAIEQYQSVVYSEIAGVPLYSLVYQVRK